MAGWLILPGCVSVAQDMPGPQRPPDGGTREVLISILIPSLANAPFTGTVNTESIRQLADGTTITLKNHRAIARDTAGRIFQERRLLVPDDGRHESVVTQIEISDPVAHTLYICVPRERVCQLEQFSAPGFAPPPSVGATPNQPGNLSRQDLGKQLLGGVETVGTLETAVIESGVIGNDSPIMVKREYWYSPQLGVNLISKRQDPRFGTQNFEVSDIVLGSCLHRLPASKSLTCGKKSRPLLPLRNFPTELPTGLACNLNRPENQKISLAQAVHTKGIVVEKFLLIGFAG